MQQQIIIITTQPFLSSHSSHSTAILAYDLHMLQNSETNFALADGYAFNHSAFKLLNVYVVLS